MQRKNGGKLAGIAPKTSANSWCPRNRLQGTKSKPAEPCALDFDHLSRMSPRFRHSSWFHNSIRPEPWWSFQIQFQFE